MHSAVENEKVAALLISITSHHWGFPVQSKGLLFIKKKNKIPSSLQQEVVHLVLLLLGLPVAILVSFAFQPENAK
jgi:hypothetical protein